MTAPKSIKKEKRSGFGMKGKLAVSLFLIGFMFIATSFLAVMQYEQVGIFDEVFLRISVPVFVAIGVGIALLLMLLFFITTYYIRPIEKMLFALRSYRDFSKNYTVDFAGDDRLKELNDSIAEVVAENQQLKDRIKNLKASLKQ